MSRIIYKAEWEYLTAYQGAQVDHGVIDEMLNDYGKSNWEFIMSYTYDADTKRVFIFKRQKTTEVKPSE